MASQVADYEITRVVADDGVLPCLEARRPARLGNAGAPVTIWALGPSARTSWDEAQARARAMAGARGPGLPDWLEMGTGEWGRRQVVWVSAATQVSATLATAPAQMSMPARLRAIATAARGAHALHEKGLVHGAICPQAITLLGSSESGGAAWRTPAGEAPGYQAAVVAPGTTEASAAPGVLDGRAVLAPPSLADGQRPAVQVGYPPLGLLDPQLLRGEGGRWSDIWALGATVRVVTSGSAPFPGMDEMPVVQALSRLLTVPTPTPAQVPPAVAGLVAACLSLGPADRPATAAEVADRLDQAAANW